MNDRQAISNNVKEYQAILEKNGVVLIENLYPTNLILDLRNQYNKLWSKVRTRVSKSPTPRTGVINFEETEILYLARGRYDFYWGMEKGIFASDRFLQPPILRELMKNNLVSDYAGFPGALPSLPGSSPGPWHRDTYSLFGDEALESTLPPFYFTVLIPLDDLSEEEGPTEFILGSHRGRDEGTRIMTCRAGDAIVVHGMTRHRGGANKSGKERAMVYISYYKNWYNDHP